MRWIVYISILVLLSSCEKHELGPQYLGDDELIDGRRILLLNEGNFGWGNSSLSIYYPDSNKVSNQVFQGPNGRLLGDVAQSMTRIGGRDYIVVNNSGKIEVVTAGGVNATTTMTGFQSPRYIAEADSAVKAYVTDLYSGSIAIVDLNSHAISGSIPAGGWTEQIVVHSGFAYVTMPDAAQLIKIDVVSDQIVDSVSLVKGATGIVVDLNQNLRVLCSGGYNEDTAALYTIDPGTMSVSQTLKFSSTAESPGALALNPATGGLYYIEEDVYKISASATQLPSNALYPGSGHAFYSLGFDPLDQHVYVSDAKDFIQNSEVYRLDTSGTLIDQFTAGIITGFFFAD